VFPARLVLLLVKSAEVVRGLRQAVRLAGLLTPELLVTWAQAEALPLVMVPVSEAHNGKGYPYTLGIPRAT
jgi:hypothetical protein